MATLPLATQAARDHRARETRSIAAVLGDVNPGEDIMEWALRTGFRQLRPDGPAPVWTCEQCGMSQEMGWNEFDKRWEVTFAEQRWVWQEKICPRCMAAKRAKAMAEMTVEARWVMSEFVPLAFRDARMDQLPGSVATTMEAWLRQSHPLPLVLVGDCGTGKTHAAFAGCYWWAKQQQQFPAIHKAKRWLADIKRVIGEDGDPDEECERLAAQSTLMVVDDLLSDRVTDFAASCWYTIVDHRIDHRLPLLITINPPPGTPAARARQAALVDIEKAGMHRVAERLQNATWVVMAGKNWRKPA